MRQLLPFRALVSTIVIFGALACGGGGDTITPPPPAPTVASITITPTTATLTAAGQTASLSAQVMMSNGTIGTQSVTWSSSNPAVATVAGGTVTAVSSGQTTVTAAVGSVSAQAAITVAIPVVQTITVTPATATLTAAGQTATFVAEVRLSNGATSNQTPVWSSSNTAVATVSSAGVVSAVASGQTNIIATIGSITGQAALTVAIPTVQNITVTPATASLGSLGATTSLSAVVRLSNGAVGTQTPVWTSSNSAVATVSGGTVTAVGNGTANISATVGSVSGTAAITVAQVAASVRILPTDTVMKTAGPLRGAALDARGNVIANAPLQWTSVNPAVATVSATGAIAPLRAGVARISVSSGAFTATSIVRSIANIQVLSDLTPLFEYTASAGQRRAFSDVSQNHADARASVMGQVWNFLQTQFPSSGPPATDMFFTTWSQIWLEASPFCGGVLFPNSDVYQVCTSPTWRHYMIPGQSPNDYHLITRFLTRQFMLSSMTRIGEFPWLLAGYNLWLAGGSFQGDAIVGKVSPTAISDFRNGDTRNTLASLDSLLRTQNVQFFQDIELRTPVAVRQAQSAIFVAFLDRDHPTVLPAILARIRATPGGTLMNNDLLDEIRTRTGRTLEQLNVAYLAYARSLQP